MYTGSTGPAATAASRIPAGHPEAFLEAFANVYAGIADAIRGDPNADYPTVADGARGVAFIETTVESAHSDTKWTQFRLPAG